MESQSVLAPEWAVWSARPLGLQSMLEMGRQGSDLELKSQLANPVLPMEPAG